jgi:hypothetical protein
VNAYNSRSGEGSEADSTRLTAFTVDRHAR